MARGSDWSDSEVALTIEDYFDMLLKEVENKPFNKAEHRRALLEKLDGRSHSSVERKHQNISAVLMDMHIAPIEGYKPLAHYQLKLVESVADYINRHPEVIHRLDRLFSRVPSEQPGLARSVEEMIVASPELLHSEVREPGHLFSRLIPPLRVDFSERERSNRKLGRMGEKFVLDFEKRRLDEHGRDDLASRVEWVARTQGDGLGYDVVSFDETTDSERLIEVKTTNQGRRAPFYLTANEYGVSGSDPQRFRLYRVFDFSNNPRIFILEPPLESKCMMQPSVYRASF